MPLDTTVALLQSPKITVDDVVNCHCSDQVDGDSSTPWDRLSAGATTAGMRHGSCIRLTCWKVEISHVTDVIMYCDKFFWTFAT